jgi:hypothetical protein
VGSCPQWKSKCILILLPFYVCSVRKYIGEFGFLTISIRNNAGSHDTNNIDRYVFYKPFPDTLRFNTKDFHQKMSISSDF